jgi:hypothetical protein
MRLLRNHSCRIFIAIVSLFAGRASALAQNGGQVTALGVLDGSLYQIRPDSSVTVQDTAFFDPANAGKIDSTYGVQNQVTLMINEASTLYFRTAFSVTVTLRISYTDSHGDTASTIRSFTVGYDSSQTYNSRSSFVFSGAHQVTVQVLSDSSNVTTWDPTSVLLIENQLTTTPGYIFSCTNTVTNITVSSVVDTADELPVTWTPVQGANQYDLEWTWVDSSALDTTHGVKRYGSPYSPALIFKNSSTRITTTGTSYNIPLIYDNTGTVFIRVRPVQTTASSYVVTNAIWSSDASPSVMGSFNFRGHERPLNWQSNISFAEQGKRKVVVQYYDGSLRSRQTVTKDNTTNTTIVAETYYDYQGRPAVQVMPAPTLQTIIQYTPAFNIDSSLMTYSQSDFDTVLPATGFCDLHADSMSNKAGASLYYSPNNPQASAGLNQFIPDAHDYPFTETEYMPDNTGRIKRQGGVGPYHQLGTGHETKYFYGTPDQNEIDALFGTEVGDKSHYFKNMVRDANGQYSVSYVDMHGRTIATALAGNPPAYMASLPSFNGRTITETLADSGSVAIIGQTMVSQKTLLVPMLDTFYFNYSFLPDVFNSTNCQSSSVCYTCRYDLTITITDNCNNQLLPGGQPYTVTKQNFSLSSLRSSCVDSTMTIGFSLPLPEGSYTITKTLTVDPDAYAFYRDSIYLPNNTCTSISQFITQQKAVAEAANPTCTPTCAQCDSSVGTFSQYLAKYNQALGLGSTDTTYQTEARSSWQVALSSCSSLCQTTTAADDITNAMLQDMTPPYGQYADTSENPGANPYSIFYVKAPVNSSDTSDYAPLYTLSQIVYLDENGLPDSAYDARSGLMVRPNELTPAEFAQAFKPSWASALLPYHPEYCKLQVMQNNSASLYYDRRMEAIGTYRQAVDSGFINPTGATAFNTYGSNTGNVDPLTSVLGAQLNNMLTNYKNLTNINTTLNLWEFACMTTTCDSGSAGIACITNYAGGTTKAFDSTVICSGDLDQAWRNFRELYLGAKQELFYANLLSDQVIQSTCTPNNNRAYSTVPPLKTLVSKGYRAEFSDAATSLSYNGLSTNNGVDGSSTAAIAVQDSTGAMLDSFYTANIYSDTTQWLQQMSSCTVYNPADVDGIILPGLIALARQACDSAHPYGASTLPPGQTIIVEGLSCTSFQDIINHYNQLHSITDTLDCNAEVITSPLPYGNQPIYSNKPLLTRPSDCECGLIKGFYSQYTLSTYGDTSFSAFLWRTQQIRMSSANLTTLLGMCDTAAGALTCGYLSQPIYLPPAMQCNAGPGCARCQTIDSLYSLYKLSYPTDTPSIVSNTDTAQVQKNMLFQNFMNNRLGFNLQAWQYVQFMDTCSAHSADTTTTTSCTSGYTPSLTVAQTFSSATGSIDNMVSICGATDGGFVLAGYKGVLGQMDTAYLMRYNSAGQIQWAKTYVNAGGSNFWKVRATADGGFVAAGAANLSSIGTTGTVLILKTDSAGNTTWQQTPGFTTSVRSDQAFDIIQTSDGGYVVVGDHNVGYPFNGPANMLCMKLNSDGNVLWARSLGLSTADGGTGNDGYAVAENNDTLIVLGRQTSSSFGGVQGMMIKLDESTGNAFSYISIKDSSQVPGGSDFYGLQAFGITTTGTCYHIADYVSDGGQGYNGRYGFVDIGFNGALIGASRMNLAPGNSDDDIAQGTVLATLDGGWLTGDTTQSTRNISWIKVDSTGDVMWTRETMLPGTQYAGSVIQNSDSTYTVLGNDGGVAMVLSLSSSGSAGCYDSTVSFGVTIPNIEIYPAQQTEYDSALTSSGISSSVSGASLGIAAIAITCAGSGNCYSNYNGPLLCGMAAPLLPTVAADSTTPCTDSTFFGTTTGTALFNTYSDSLTGAFGQNYLNLCMRAYTHESFTVTHTESEYHYTLYYYDQAGNLLKTVPPAGVQQDTDSTWLSEVRAARAAGTVLVPSHTLVTNYRYNTLNQLVAQNSPDGSTSNFWYDRLGRLAISQNGKQLPNNQYSYTQYDTIGRIIQVGQLTSSAAITDTISRSASSLATWESNAASTANQITITTYDTGSYAIAPLLGQRNMRNRVSWTALFNTAADLANWSPNAAAATYYTYDILGNVDTLVQDFGGGNLYSDVANSMNVNGNRFKKIAYNFDLVSGKVNQVNYQHGFADAFYHSYLYDAENRITNVMSSTDSINWDNDAYYSYYAHGPVSRTVLGQQQVQGINYAYTLQGWLKAINPAPDTASPFTLRPDSSGNVVANTAYNLLLDYFQGDYSPISTAAGPDSAVSTTLGADYRPLYNGNISSMGTRIRGLSSPLLYNYQYDQLNRLIHMDAWNRTGTPWSAITKISDFQENVAYDPNGNIQKYKRNGNSSISLGMDSLNYFYIPGTNKLDHITDSVTSTCSGCNDITTQSAGNYQYDSIGELTADAGSNITGITWTVYGKIASITKSTDTTIFFTYDASGHRISKSVVHAGDTLTTWYARDAQGNILSVYTYGDPSTNGKDLSQTELDIYGSSRLGMWKRSVNVEITPPSDSVSMPLFGKGDSLIFTRGNKLFELTNHLGNVLAAISDKRYGVSTDDSTVVYYNPEVVSANDYYPFGMLQPGRQYAESNLGSYRYGFNGQEKTDEIAGTGNHTTAEFWEYDVRVGRRWNLDPKPTVGVSQYLAFNGNPILYPDPLGDSASPVFRFKIPAEFVVNSYEERMDKAIVNLDDKMLNELRPKYLSAVKTYQKEWEANVQSEVDEFFRSLAPPSAPPSDQNSTPGNFTRTDARNGLNLIIGRYGKDLAITIERIYRLETRNFTSGQFKHTGTAGMQVEGPAPYYGWTPSYFTDLPTGTWSIFENKGLSGIGGNAQNTKTKTAFVLMPSVSSGMIFLANFIIGHDGNPGRWFSTDPARQNLYNTTIMKNVTPTIVNGLSNDK